MFYIFLIHFVADSHNSNEIQNSQKLLTFWHSSFSHLILCFSCLVFVFFLSHLVYYILVHVWIGIAIMFTFSFIEQNKKNLTFLTIYWLVVLQKIHSNVKLNRFRKKLQSKNILMWLKRQMTPKLNSKVAYNVSWSLISLTQ